MRARVEAGESCGSRGRFILLLPVADRRLRGSAAARGVRGTCSLSFIYAARQRTRQHRKAASGPPHDVAKPADLLNTCPGREVSGFRSEERRVGKECRSRWSE